VTLLTVGTHHRYNVPNDFNGESEHGSSAWAFEYLDLAIGRFVSELEAAGVLENTLVLITSDESQANEAGASDARNMLMHGWGFLIALLPSHETATVDQVFAQPDVPISILDYAQLDSRFPDFSGRSVFRRYDHGRNVYWGNTYLGLVAGLSPEFDLTICTEDFTTCGTYRKDHGTLFSPDKVLRESTFSEVSRLRSAAHRSLSTQSENRRRRNLSLISTGLHPVIRTSGEQYVFGGQFLALPVHSRTDVEIVVKLDGRSGWVDVAHNFLVDLKPLHVWTERIHVGETLNLRYTVGAKSVLEKVECRLWITDFDGDDLSLDFEKAELDISVIPPSEPAPESVVHTFAITGRQNN